MSDKKTADKLNEIINKHLMSMDFDEYSDKCTPTERVLFFRMKDVAFAFTAFKTKELQRQVEELTEQNTHYIKAYDLLHDKLAALSQPKEVDLDELRNEFLLSFNFDYPCGYNNIWEFFLPHLQKPVESDAVEFLECTLINGWRKLEDIWEYSDGEQHMTGNELYEQFKQLKK